MEKAVLLVSVIIIIRILLNDFLEKIPVPSLIIFILLGMCFGENGIFKISFDNYSFVNIICSVSLIFIMFYGGFGTNLKAAKPVVAQSVLLSTVGVAGTAGAVGLFSHFVLHLPWLESILIGSVISSTDAASVFNILRSRNLALKNNTDSLLEIESGSNDPISYMLTTSLIAIMLGQDISVPALLIQQMLFGVLFGVLVAKLSIYLFKTSLFKSQESVTIFLFAVMLLSFSLPYTLNGNGYLSVYLCGIILGNSTLIHKKYLVHFFDVSTDVAQVIIFFLLGLLVTPVDLPRVMIPSLMIMLFLTLVARPLVSSVLLAPFRSSPRQIALVSWSGLRGVASIVFAISVVLSGVETKYNLFNLVFCIVILSISIQGTFLPWVANKLSMIDKNADVRKTFNDYQEDSDISFIKIHLDKNHPWKNLEISKLGLPRDLLIAMIVRNHTPIVPKGDTVLEVGDLLVFAARSFEDRKHLSLREIVIDKKSKWVNTPLHQITTENPYLIILIKRNLENIIPTGDTKLLPGDILIMATAEE